MNLLSRYVEAVKRYLPLGSREDTGRELSSLLQENLDALAEKKGAPLDDDEVAAFLRDYGHPYKVARGYSAHRNLVSEKAYPLYRRALAALLSLLLVIDVVIALGRLGEDDGTSALRVIPLFLNDVLGTLLFGFAAVTAVFHWWGDRFADKAALWRFDPRKLPEIGEGWANVGLRATFYDIILTVLCLAVLVATYHAHSDAAGTVRVNPVAVSWVSWLAWLAVACLVVHLVNLFQRYWTRLKLGVIAVAGALAALIALRLVFVGGLLQVALRVTGVANDALAAQWLGWWPGWWVKLFLLAVAVHLGWRAYVHFRRAASDRVPFA